VRAWNLMGGMDWAALPMVVELLGIEEVDILIMELTAIRDAQRGND